MEAKSCTACVGDGTTRTGAPQTGPSPPASNDDAPPFVAAAHVHRAKRHVDPHAGRQSQPWALLRTTRRPTHPRELVLRGSCRDAVPRRYLRAGTSASATLAAHCSADCLGARHLEAYGPAINPSVFRTVALEMQPLLARALPGLQDSHKPHATLPVLTVLSHFISAPRHSLMYAAKVTAQRNGP